MAALPHKQSCLHCVAGAGSSFIFSCMTGQIYETDDDVREMTFNVDGWAKIVQRNNVKKAVAVFMTVLLCSAADGRAYIQRGNEVTWQSDVAIQHDITYFEGAIDDIKFFVKLYKMKLPRAAMFIMWQVRDLQDYSN